MSSTSIARQNRRMRLRQVPGGPPNINTKLLSLSASQLLSTEEMSDVNSQIQLTSEISSDKKILDDDDDDTKSNQLVESNGYEQNYFPTSCSFMSSNASSIPVQKIFIEGERGFKEINISEILQFTNAELSVQSDKKELINIAFKITQYFHSLSNFCHGLLGGISLLYVLMLLHLFSSLSVNEETIKYFSFFSQPVHNIFNFLCIICCISVYDRFDIANARELCKLVRKLDFKLITVLIYPICFIMSLSTANVDEKLNLLERNSTIWISSDLKEEEIYYWKTLSISKSFMALLGWIIICLDPYTNLFFNQLSDIEHKKNPSQH